MSAEPNKSTSKEKRETLERFLGEEHVLVHVFPKGEGVVIPDHLQRSPTVTLKLSRYFRGKMDITPTVVTAELLFGDKYFECQIPFDAVWGMTSFRGQFLMWPDSTPAEVLAGLERQSEARRTEALTAEEAAPKDEAPAAEEDSSVSKAGKKGHLRRVK